MKNETFFGYWTHLPFYCTEHGQIGRAAMRAMWIMQLLVSFLVTFVIIGAMVCANAVPAVVGVFDKRSSKKLSAAMSASTMLM